LREKVHSIPGIPFSFRFQLIILIVLLLAFGCSTKETEQFRPNVIIIMTDDQGYGDMSCHGNPWLQTPNIDELYNESTRLTDFHVDPTCSPTRAALMTGRYATRTGVWLTYMGRHYLRQDEITMADIFRNKGYRTAIFGKWHLGDNYPYRPEDRGFETSLVHGGGVVGEAPDYWGNDYYDDTYLRNGKEEKAEGYCTDVWFREATRFAKSVGDHPFFLYIPTNAPHNPFNVPGRYTEAYEGREDIPGQRARFYGMIASIDENLGRFKRMLKEEGLLEHTILIFLTDNGTAGGFSGSEGFNAGMRARKASAFEGGHRAACFIRWPGGGIREGRDLDALTAHLDLMPTLASLCKLDLPEDHSFDGMDLSGYLLGENRDDWPERTLFVHHQGRFGQRYKMTGPSSTRTMQ
jgi:arylsulfatase A-like enzyme